MNSFPFHCPICGHSAGTFHVKLGGYQIYVCPECKLNFAPEAFNVKVNYDSIYETTEYIETQIDPVTSAEDFIRFIDILTYRPFFKNVSGNSKNKLLDVGCGVGRFCHAAKARGWDVTGIDISKNAIKMGKRYATFPMYEGGVEDIIKHGKIFDVVTAFEVLEHLSNPVDFIEDCKKILKPNGQLFLTVPNWDCVLVQNATQIDWLPPLHVCFYTQAALRNLIEFCGLKLISIGTIVTDPKPKHLVDRLKWIARRLAVRPRFSLGIWSLAKKVSRES